MQGTPAQSLVQEDSTGLEATRPAGCLQWAYWSGQVKPECLERLLCNNRSHRSEKPARRNSRAVSARCKYSQATQSKGHPAQPEKKKRTRCYPIITPQNWRSGDSGPADACPGRGCCSLHPPPRPLDSICRPTAAVPPGTRTRSLLSPPPPPAWTQHGPGFFLSPASRSKPHAHTHS